MADYTYGGGPGSHWDADDVAEHTRVTEWLNWAGALLSLALILGLAAWGWQLMKRDVSGVPVVRALEGPMRVAPEDPGGRLAEHQGLAVNRIAAEGTAEPPVETIVLAPAPLTLAEEDLPVAELRAEAIEVEAELETLTPASVVMPAPDVEELAPVPANATDLAVAAALASIEAGEFEIAAEEMVATRPDGGLATSPLPRARPMLVLTNVSTLSSQPDTGAVIAPGARLVQLGAFDNAAQAEEAWAATEARFADYMVGKTPVIQEAETGGRTFYRLRAAGFADLADARRFCSVLVAGELNCIPVVQR